VTTKTERLKLESTIKGKLMDVTLTFTNVYCDDKGNLTINISDGTVIHIKIAVQGWFNLFLMNTFNYQKSIKKLIFKRIP